MNTRTFGQTAGDIKNLLLCNRIMLAQDEEQKACYDSYSEKKLKEEFQFPSLDEGVKIALVRAWVKWADEAKSEVANEVFGETTFTEPFNFFKRTAELVVLMEVSYERLLENAQVKPDQLSKQGMLNFCRRALALHKHISLIQEYLDYTQSSLAATTVANPNLKISCDQYNAFCEKEKNRYVSMQSQLKSLDQMIVNEAVVTEKFMPWFQQFGAADIKLILDSKKNAVNESLSYGSNNRAT